MKFCGQCGTMCDDSANTCPNCGAAFISPKQPLNDAVLFNNTEITGEKAENESVASVNEPAGPSVIPAAVPEIKEEPKPADGYFFSVQSCPIPNNNQPPADFKYEKTVQGKGIGLCTAGCVLSICSLVSGSGLIMAIVGLILSIKGRNRYKTGLGKAGLIISIISIVLQVLLIVAVIEVMQGLEDILETFNPGDFYYYFDF